MVEQDFHILLQVLRHIMLVVVVVVLTMELKAQEEQVGAVLVLE
jgi:hypothetical protein